MNRRSEMTSKGDSIYISKWFKAITPHKGGRTIKKSADVTPETEARLREAKEKHGLSLGDLIALIAENYEDYL